MKRILAFVTAAVLCCSLAACGGEDSSAAYLGYTFEITVPEGFGLLEESKVPHGVEQYWQAADGSNITVVTMEDDGSLASEIPGDQMQQVMEESYVSQLGEDAKMSDFTFEHTEVDSCPAYRMSFALTVSGVTIRQYSMGINGDKAYTITCTDMTGGDWTEAFETMLKSGIKAVPVS